MKILRLLLVTQLLLLLACLPPSASDAAEGTDLVLLPGAGGMESPFNMLAHKGAVQAAEDYGFRLRVLQGLPPAWDKEQAEKLLRAALEQGADVVVANGLEWAHGVLLTAADHPDTRFILVDARLSQETAEPNVVSVLFTHKEGGFLAGCLAAWMSTTQRVGFIGGVPIPAVREFETGFRMGVAHAAPEVEVFSRYLSKGQDFRGFRSPQLGRKQARALFELGIDVIFAAAGQSGIGVIEAAAESRRYAIGADYDQDGLAKGTVLTSVIKRLDNAVHEELARIAENAFLPGVHLYGLRDGGIALSEMQYTFDAIPAVVREKLLELQEQLRNGVLDIAPPVRRSGPGSKENE